MDDMDGWMIDREMDIFCLVVLTIWKNISSSMGRIIPNIMEKKNV